MDPFSKSSMMATAAAMTNDVQLFIRAKNPVMGLRAISV